MNLPVNSVFQSTVPALGFAGLVTFQATTTSPPASFASGIGSPARLPNHCTGKNFYFYMTPPGKTFYFLNSNPSPDTFDAYYHDHRLGESRANPAVPALCRQPLQLHGRLHAWVTLGNAHDYGGQPFFRFYRSHKNPSRARGGFSPTAARGAVSRLENTHWSATSWLP